MSRRLTTIVATTALAVGGVLVAAEPAGATSSGVPLGIVKSLDVTNKGLIVFADGGESGVQVKSWDPAHPVNPPVVLVGGLPAGVGTAATNDRKDIWVVYAANDTGESATAWYIPYKGKPRRVLDVAAFQEKFSPDPYDIDDPPNPGESNPYDVEVLPDGSALIADAAGDDVLRVTPSGKAWTVACFPDQLESTKSVPPDIATGLPPKIPAEAVPTGVALDGHGNAYVGTLTGFPFAYGTARVFRVSVDGRNAGCSGNPAHPVNPGPVVASGFTGINDVWVGLDGALYVTELSKYGVWAVEAALGSGDPSGIAGTARVWRVKNTSRIEIAKGKLTLPGAAVLARDGHVYATNTFLFGASLVKIA
ncbi:MAG TPA: ScyD/ScyE family protein [Actinomycetes bacterium]|nr:ScyD/ScyE family protein [Actinomycetes bacterium]